MRESERRRKETGAPFIICVHADSRLGLKLELSDDNILRCSRCGGLSLCGGRPRRGLPASGSSSDLDEGAAGSGGCGHLARCCGLRGTE